jgi:hypothetical protein
MSGAQVHGDFLGHVFVEVHELVGPLGCVPFFGTLLGLVRDGRVISGDDDIDFACEAGILQEVTFQIRSNFQIHHEVDMLDPRTGAGARSMILNVSGKLVHLDFYAYTKLEDKVVFQVHWTDQRMNASHWLHIPSTLFSPLANAPYSNLESQLANFTGICSFLYGPRWDLRLRKNIDYTHELIAGVPVIRDTNLLEKSKGLAWLLYSNWYWGLRSSLNRLLPAKAKPKD